MLVDSVTVKYRCKNVATVGAEGRLMGELLGGKARAPIVRLETPGLVVNRPFGG